MTRHLSRYRPGWHRAVARLAAALLLIANTVSVLAANEGASRAPADEDLVPICTADGIVLRSLTLSQEHPTDRPERQPTHRFPVCALCVIAGQLAVSLPAVSDAAPGRTRIDRAGPQPPLAQLPLKKRFGRLPGRPRAPPSLHRSPRPAPAPTSKRQMEISA